MFEIMAENFQVVKIIVNLVLERMHKLEKKLILKHKQENNFRTICHDFEEHLIHKNCVQIFQ